MKIDKDKQLQLLQNLAAPSSPKTTADASQVSTQGTSADASDKVELSGWKIGGEPERRRCRQCPRSTRIRRRE